MGISIGGRVSDVISVIDIILLITGIFLMLSGAFVDSIGIITKLCEIATFISDILANVTNQSVNVFSTCAWMPTFVIIPEIIGIMFIAGAVVRIIYKLYVIIRSY